MLRNRPLDQLHTTEISPQLDVQLVPLSLCLQKNTSHKDPRRPSFEESFNSCQRKCCFRYIHRSQFSVEHNRLHQLSMFAPRWAGLD